jgi:predicted ribosome quality control (RQC) complex YloA/Tae2 family protein
MRIEMKRITLPEFRIIINELSLLKDNRLENIYQCDDEFTMIIEDKELAFSPSSLHLTKIPGKREISQFALILRKYLRGRQIEDIDCRNMTAELAITPYILILEIFPKFNCILCDNSYKIIMPMKFYKEIRTGDNYVFPDGPDFQDKEKFRQFLSRKYPVSLMIRDYFGKYVKIPKEVAEKPSDELKEKERKKILSDIRALFLKKKNPQVVYEGRKVIDAVPFDISTYKNLQKKYFETFNEALDFFFSKA